MIQFSYFRKNVTPQTPPFYLIGFGKERMPKEESYGLAELNVNICWIKDGTTQLVFISIDTLYLHINFTQPVFDLLKENYNVPQEYVFINATHTHSSPNIFMQHPDWDEIHSEFSYLVKSALEEGFVHCNKNFHKGYIAINAYTPLEKLFISRRKKNISPLRPFKTVTKRLPNSSAVVDQEIRTITLYNEKKVREAVVYNFSCHPVFNRNHSISSDFVGVVSNQLEKKVSFSMFMQGFCGDVRASHTGKLNSDTIFQLLSDFKHPVRNLSILLKLLIYRHIFVPYNQAYFYSFCNKLYNHIFTSIHNAEMSDSLHCLSKSFSFSINSSSGNSTKTFNTKMCKMNNILLVDIPAEVNSFYYNSIRQVLNGNSFLPLGNSHDMISYLPGYAEIEDGGYEVDSYVHYDFDTPLSSTSLKEYHQKLIDAIKQMI